MSALQKADPSLLELTPEHESRLQSALADLYYSNPDSYDWIEAMMNRITALEERMRQYEAVKT